MSYRDRINPNSKFYNTLAPTIISDEFATTATLTEATDGMIFSVAIPKGAYVTQVALLCTADIANQDLDVGDGDNVDRFLEAIVSASANDIIVAPTTGGLTAGGMVGGKYYEDADTIDVSSDVTGSANDETGSAKLLVWYFV